MNNHSSPLLVFLGKIGLVALTLMAFNPLLSGSAQDVQNYHCSPTEKMSIKVVAGAQPPAIEVTLPDGRTLVLPQAESASGAKYSNGAVTVWSKGNTALVEEGGQVKWQDCVKLP